jgi:hypothetical protein
MNDTAARAQLAAETRDGLKQLILKRLGKTDWRGSRLWCKSSGTMFQSYATDEGYVLIVGRKWRVSTDPDGTPKWIAEPVARITTDKAFTPLAFDVTHPAGRWIDTSVSNTMHYAWSEYCNTINAPMDKTSLHVGRGRAPKYVFLDPNHPATMVDRAQRPKYFRKVVLRNRPTSYEDGGLWRVDGEAIVVPGKWVRVEVDRMYNLEPLNLPAVRCDFKLARKNGKALREVEEVLYATARMSGETISATVRTINGYDPRAGTDKVQRLIDQKGELDPRDVAGNLRTRTLSDPDEAMKRFGAELPIHRAVVTVPAVARPVPARFDVGATTNVDSLEELVAFGERGHVAK